MFGYVSCLRSSIKRFQRSTKKLSYCYRQSEARAALKCNSDADLRG